MIQCCWSWLSRRCRRRGNIIRLRFVYIYDLKTETYICKQIIISTDRDSRQLSRGKVKVHVVRRGIFKNIPWNPRNNTP